MYLCQKRIWKTLIKQNPQSLVLKEQFDVSWEAASQCVRDGWTTLMLQTADVLWVHTYICLICESCMIRLPALKI